VRRRAPSKSHSPFLKRSDLDSIKEIYFTRFFSASSLHFISTGTTQNQKLFPVLSCDVFTTSFRSLWSATPVKH
jgi:hypothetical protein